MPDVLPKQPPAARFRRMMLPGGRRRRIDDQLPLLGEAGTEPIERRSGGRGHVHRVTGLFAGIGGIELGLHRAGHRADLLCEIEPAAVEVLQQRFPEVTLSLDVTRLTDVPHSTTLIAAGFPCQDLSQAGRTAGINGRNSGLVTHVFRLLEQRRVPWVLLENVSFMLRLAKGDAFRYVIDELERLGYAWAYRVVNSRSLGLPQRRERVYLLAAQPGVGDPREILFADDAGEPGPPPSHRGRACGFYWTEGIRGLGWAVDGVPTLKGGSTIGIPSPPAIWMPNGQIVTPDIRDGERLQGFPADWTAPASAVAKRGARWKLVGNAVTVDVAEWIGARMQDPGVYDPTIDVPLQSKAPWPNAAWSMSPGRRFAANVSVWPFHCEVPPLAEFLEYPTLPLSPRATAGFFARTQVSSLRFPEGFLAAVAAHLRDAGVESATV